jgi:hypothetical protein
MAPDSELLEGRALSDCLSLMDSPEDRRDAIDRMTPQELRAALFAAFEPKTDDFPPPDEEPY